VFDQRGPASGGAFFAAGCFAEPSGFFTLPMRENEIQQFFAVAEVPIETALADVKVAGKDFDANSLDPFPG
jgi:hypothetical protein